MFKLNRRQFGALVIGAAVLAPAQASLSRALGPAPLAIKGYDPVAYFSMGKPVAGSPDIEFTWDELRYRFARPEHREMFKADPTRYAPQFENYCAMSLTRGEVVEANPEYWLIRDGKLFLFGKPIGPELFQQAFHDNMAKTEQHRGLVRQR
jgi:hypothetical protein